MRSGEERRKEDPSRRPSVRPSASSALSVLFSPIRRERSDIEGVVE